MDPDDAVLDRDSFAGQQLARRMEARFHAAHVRRQRRAQHRALIVALGVVVAWTAAAAITVMSPPRPERDAPVTARVELSTVNASLTSFDAPTVRTAMHGSSTLTGAAAPRPPHPAERPRTETTAVRVDPDDVDVPDDEDVAAAPRELIQPGESTESRSD